MFQIVMGGKNKYLINGINVQNKRVIDLFCSIQLNVNNPHFLIMQGRITKVLNMKPPEVIFSFITMPCKCIVACIFFPFLNLIFLLSSSSQLLELGWLPICLRRYMHNLSFPYSVMLSMHHQYQLEDTH